MKNLTRCGRKPKLSLRVVQKLCRKVNIKPRVVFKDITKSLDMLGINVNICTVQYCLNRNELYGHWLWWTTLHEPCHIDAQFDFAKMFLDKENCFWELVLWSNEIKIELFRHNDIQEIWHQKSEAYLSKNIMPWWCFGVV